jgi:PAS domain S-box-containing protein
MGDSALKRFTGGTLPVLVLLALLLVALHLMSSAVQNAETLSRLFVPLLVFIILGLVTLVTLVVVNVVQLVTRYRRQAAGSRLTLRMVLVFVVLALVPVTVVYFYSQQFLMHGIDSWFDVEIDQAMEDTLALSRASLDQHKRERLRMSQMLVSELNAVSITGLTMSLDSLRERYGASELALMKLSGGVIASSNADPTILVPDRPDTSILQQVRNGADFVGVITKEGEEVPLQVRVVVADRSRRLILQALYPTSTNISTLTEKVQGAYTHYKELAFLRKSLKSTFTLTLALVLLFSLLAAIWAAFFSARRLVAPVADIAEGTKAVAAGDYDKQLPLPRSRDELAFLVSSFNTMTRRIAQARDAAGRSQGEVEAQRTYLETVLSGLSSGVMAFDPDGSLRTVNPAACEILGLEGDHLGEHLDLLAGISSHIQQFVEAVRAALSPEMDEWRGEIVLFSSEGRQVLLCRSTPLVRSEQGQAGRVLVFDDITTLIRAQRDAAWGEVARRLAHEIKNPLTPIRLSAERLRHKYLRKMAPEDAEVLDRSTHTIVQQVEAMKEMVDAFSAYARPPKMNPQSLVLDALVSEVLDLYRSEEVGLEFSITLEAEQANIQADPVRMRQVVHNLLKNAQEAVADREQGRVEISTCQKSAADCMFIELRISDNGPGFDSDNLSHLFEPYVTTKVKGTGLGLAIVKKIVEEHGGMIWAENRAAGGASVILRLPMLDTESGENKICGSLPESGTERKSS